MYLQLTLEFINTDCTRLCSVTRITKRQLNHLTYYTVYIISNVVVPVSECSGVVVGLGVVEGRWEKYITRVSQKLRWPKIST